MAMEGQTKVTKFQIYARARALELATLVAASELDPWKYKCGAESSCWEMWFEHW